ncbi:MAG: PDZ domain-containing protein [Woeseiaceae bacterium]|nr:PDZ domain-containing protein [Woeseiaceae bacterium]
MKVVVLASVASFIVAFATATWMYAGENEERGAPARSGDSTAFNAGLPVEDRIAALERAVSDERVARQLLQEEVFYLTSELDRIAGAGEFGPELAVAESSGDSDSTSSASSRRESRRRANTTEGRIERLIEAGFLPNEASMIVQRESELRMDWIRERYEAERSGEPFDFFRSRDYYGQELRDELGDADYERYLKANNQSTSITVSSVFESSPAQSAGLQPGDEIIRYDGARVFNMSDLTRHTMDGNPGDNIVVDILRNGQPMQVVMPRGPLGVSGGRRSR